MVKRNGTLESVEEELRRLRLEVARLRRQITEERTRRRWGWVTALAPLWTWVPKLIEILRERRDGKQ